MFLSGPPILPYIVTIVPPPRLCISMAVPVLQKEIGDYFRTSGGTTINRYLGIPNSSTSAAYVSTVTNARDCPIAEGAYPCHRTAAYNGGRQISTVRSSNKVRTLQSTVYIRAFLVVHESQAEWISEYVGCGEKDYLR